MFTEIDNVTKYLQTHMLMLEQGHFALDSLIDKVAEKKTVLTHAFYQCRLGMEYIVPDADIMPDPHFESGIVKIQCGKFIAIFIARGHPQYCIAHIAP